MSQGCESVCLLPRDKSSPLYLGFLWNNKLLVLREALKSLSMIVLVLLCSLKKKKSVMADVRNPGEASMTRHVGQDG